MNKNILAICSTLDFQRFTRRATIEAIAKKYQNIEALCEAHVNNIRKEVNNFSNVLEVKSFYYFIPKNLRDSFPGRVEKTILKIKWKKYFNKFDIILITYPTQYYFLDYIKGKKIIFLISDPYHLSNNIASDQILKNTQYIYNLADIVLTTSINLKKNYIPKYIGDKKLSKVHYWPNTVDMEIWNYKRHQTNYKPDNKPIIGMAGNINNRTDLNLLDYITQRRPKYQYILCGINYLKGRSKIEKFHMIIKKPNVEYLGYIDFNILPKLINSWDIGITIEGKNEYTQYVHHNKIYQYMALGLPVVTFKINEEYRKLNDLIFIPGTYEEFVENIDAAIKKLKNKKYISQLRRAAMENSSIVRAEQFNKIIDNNM